MRPRLAIEGGAGTEDSHPGKPVEAKAASIEDWKEVRRHDQQILPRVATLEMPEHEGDPSFRAAGQDAGKDERHSLWRRDWRSHHGSAITLHGRGTDGYTPGRPPGSSR